MAFQIKQLKMRLLGNDDFGHMAETIKRRLREENRKKWGTADLMLIDGGKGQLAAAIAARNECQQTIPMIGLAKRQEEIIFKKTGHPALQTEVAKKMGAYVNEEKDFITIGLSTNSNIVKLLQRIRDESHRFAVSYHSTLKRHRQTASLLDEIPGVGPLTRKKLIRHFGSAKAAIAADQTEIIKIFGPQRGLKLSNNLSKLR
jgi:excinuclease ABC subunit C